MECEPSGNILLVEDDAALRVAVGKRLVRAGFRVVTASTGDEALRRARESAIHAVVMDVRLPGTLDGLDAARLLHGCADTRRVPIVFVTGSADESFKSRCAAAGGVYYLSKPFDGDLLVQTLRGLFAQDALSEIERVSRAKRRQPVCVPPAHVPTPWHGPTAGWSG